MELLLCDGSCEFNLTNTSVVYSQSWLGCDDRIEIVSCVQGIVGHDRKFGLGSQIIVRSPCVFQDNSVTSVVLTGAVGGLR
jgi:hypothetical protein